MALKVQVKILDDALREEEEKFTVELTAFDLSVVLVNSITEVVIEDDDGEGKCTLYSMKEYHALSHTASPSTNCMSFVLPHLACIACYFQRIFKFSIVLDRLKLVRAYHVCTM